jgi:hypothetical protein
MRVARGLQRGRQVELLQYLGPLREDLEKAPVYEVGSKRQSQEGIARSSLGHVCQFLARHLDRSELENFISQLGRLDFATGQNLVKPSGQHEALKKILQGFLKDHPDLDAEDLLFVFSWAQRFLKDEIRRLEDRTPPPLDLPIRNQTPPGKSAIELALLKAQENKIKKK